MQSADVNGRVTISIHALLAESDKKGSGKSTTLTNFYPRSPCGERRVHYDNYNLHCVISIHALLAESDGRITSNGTKKLNFYPRSPCGERRTLIITAVFVTRFLSTLSLRRATRIAWEAHQAGKISIHALLAESDNELLEQSASYNISIHALLAESDCITDGSICLDSRISIHALLAESDHLLLMLASGNLNFYPRSPCGERLDGCCPCWA